MACDSNAIVSDYVDSKLSISDIAIKRGLTESIVRNRLRISGVSLRPAYIDLTGEQFGLLEVITIIRRNKRGECIWLCRCSCGREIERSGSVLRRGHNVHCWQCQQPESLLLSLRKQVKDKWFSVTSVFIQRTRFLVGDITQPYWTYINRSAKARKKLVLITPDYAWSQFIHQNRRCFFTGEPLTLPTLSRHWKYRNSWNASIDRLDSNLDYVEDNIAWILKDLQWMKNRYSPQKFIELCHKVSDFTRNSTRMV